MNRHAITIGTFDGIHAGHAALVNRARSIAGPSGRVSVLAFDPHPRSVISVAPARLTTWPTRERLLKERGADAVIRLEPSESLLALDPEHFVQSRVVPLGVTDIVEGPDFRFGRRRAGDVGVLEALGDGFGFRVHRVEGVTAQLDDRGRVEVSSSLVRSLLRHGRVREVARLLDRPYRIEGEVVRGDRLGRTLGVPTANLDAHNAPPGPGVYAGTATLSNGRTFAAAINIGTRPTVNGPTDRIEAHLIDPQRDQDGTINDLPEYGWPLSLDFISRLRDEVRFPSLEALQGQLSRDIDRAAAAVHQESPP